MVWGFIFGLLPLVEGAALSGVKAGVEANNSGWRGRDKQF